MITGSWWPVLIYTDHHALTSVLHKGSNNQHMQTWENRLGEYDYIVRHQPNTNSLMCVADRLSRIPTQYQIWLKAEDNLDPLVAAATTEPPSGVTPNNNRVMKYQQSAYY